MAKDTGRHPLADAVTAGAILLLGVLLTAVGVGLREQWQQSSAHLQELGAEDLLGGAAAVAGGILVVWWFLSLLLAGATTVLDRVGKYRAAAVTRKLSPAFMQRLVLAALSVQLAAGPAAHADAGTSGPGWAPTQDHVSSVPADPGNGTDRAKALPPLEDIEKDDAPPPSKFDPRWQPAAPVIDPGLLAAPPLRSASGPGMEPRAVTVLAGDTLWDIAAFAMGPEATDVEIAREWPRWYEANRDIIGQTPDVLLPGQILQPPATA
jgi:hypothetical protein